MRKTLLRAFLAICAMHVSVAASAIQNATPTQSKGGQTETPSQFYLRYRSAVQSASNLEEVTRYWQKSLVGDFMQAPPDQRADLAGFKRMYGMVSDVNVVSVSMGGGGSTAMLTLAGKTADGKKMSGTASLVQEGGGWKLAAPEDWQEPSSK